MLLKYHPDKNIGDEDEACRQMQRLQDAYAVAIKKFHAKRPLEEAVASGDVAQVLASAEAMNPEDVRDFVDAEGNTLLHLVCAKCPRNVSRRRGTDDRAKSAHFKPRPSPSFSALFRRRQAVSKRRRSFLERTRAPRRRRIAP